MASDIGKIETEAQFLAIKDVLMLCNQNKPFYSSMSTRNQSVSSTGKVETTGSTFRYETALAGCYRPFATISKKAIRKFYCKESINLPNTSCPSVVCLKTPASSKPRSKISPTF